MDEVKLPRLKRFCHTDKTLNKSFRVTVRLTPHQQLILEEFCRANGVDASTAIRVSVELMERLRQGHKL